MKIDELLNRYFEGETSCEEERELRRFFTEDQVPEDLETYRPLFVCLDQEAKIHQSLRNEVKETNKYFSPKHRLYYIIGSVAAGILLLIGITDLCQNTWTVPSDYVIINGKRYTDAKTIREQALSAFQDVQMNQDEVLDLMFE
ncbi:MULTISPECIES: hypothetical protein [Bacteroides]|uniref:hypothetical protein n=1 Tax=Bacteroides TaxID=816 RepID=UPI000C7721CB|nr:MULTISPECIES: hypothetical protein [Bacteroides]RGM44570.1 hypothetical protein DXC10_15240 [Bacteroides sp. OM08-11]